MALALSPGCHYVRADLYNLWLAHLSDCEALLYQSSLWLESHHSQSWDIYRAGAGTRLALCCCPSPCAGGNTRLALANLSLRVCVHRDVQCLATGRESHLARAVALCPYRRNHRGCAGPIAPVLLAVNTQIQATEAKRRIWNASTSKRCPGLNASRDAWLIGIFWLAFLAYDA